MNLFDLYARITLDTGDYEDGLSKAKNTMTNAAKAIYNGAHSVEDATNSIKSPLNTLTEIIDRQSNTLASLKTQYVNLALEQGEESDELQALGQEISRVSEEIVEYTSQIDRAKKAANQFDSAIEKAGNETEDAGEKAKKSANKFNSLASVLKGGLATAAKVGAAAIGAASAAVGALVKSSVDEYSQYEQLVGGVETLFKQSADAVMGYAENAYQTAGMSANEYMETVTSFSASLLQSLGGDTDAAAEKANLAITDMADNANKMGSSMESIQNAYSGFSRGNYTMLDNLKIGYAGTKEEMQRLLEDAEKISGIEYDISSYADIVDAIHVVQTEMGITGTTALEASSTIQGSVSSMKAAWSNFVTGLGNDNADITELSTQLIDSVVTVADNAIPVIETVLSNIATAVTDYAPEMIEKFVSYAIDKLPDIVALGMRIIVALGKGIAENFPEIVRAALETVDAIVSTIIESLPELKDVGNRIVEGIWEGIKGMMAWFKEKIKDFFGAAVGEVKDFLGIRSPSRVFADIGKNMALGLGEGWEDEFSAVQGGINSSLDFGTARVDFASSGAGMVSSAMMNSMSAGAQSGGTYTFNLMLPDGTQLASYLFGPMVDYSRAKGTPILNPT